MTPEQFLATLETVGLRLGISASGTLTLYGNAEAKTERIDTYIRLNVEQLIELAK
ncbi:MAG: hypothetical protein ACRDHZ_00255 [Ktedonobacteraceae bacterium]